MANRRVRHVATDGAAHAESLSRKASQSPPRADVCSIFVHAGAGYHSIQNERIHLEACNDAAAIAMLILRNGGSAVDAVEMAVKVLEDREITNAGYGSNLAMDGVVECDASVVDHLGRSGAVGAVAQIKNPVSLARMVLDHSMQALTLRRVPPNLLVSQGATDFAYEMGVPILPYDALISPAAKDRWLRWRADLKIAERKAKRAGNPSSYWKIRPDTAPEEIQARQRMRQQHEQTLLQSVHGLQSPNAATRSSGSLFVGLQTNPFSGTTSYAGPISQGSSDFWASEGGGTTEQFSLAGRAQEPESVLVTPHTAAESSRNAFINSTQKVPTISQLKKDNSFSRNSTPERSVEDVEMSCSESDRRPTTVYTSSRKGWGDGSSDKFSPSTSNSMLSTHPNPSVDCVDTPQTDFSPREGQIQPTSNRILASYEQNNEDVVLPAVVPAVPGSDDLREDNITDTVGAIAVDGWGHIACAASSGGIGMKYRGRIGPAALVGVGAAVIPTDEDDPDETCVATVTSGTGEHMATTMAATVCAERLYQSVRKGKAGIYEEVNEDEALKAMIENEFMGHPSVRNSNSAGAIGILGIKKMRGGVFFYFGHNTDSFAMASMHSDEERPLCSMSRSNGNGAIAQGGRMHRTMTRRKKMGPFDR